MAAILLLAAWLRFDGLAARSLWADEFCTWKVSQMPLADSLRWQPELTKPPLYQFVLRASASTDQPRIEAPSLQGAPRGVPSEWHLRLPAAICGILSVGAMWWLGWLAGGWPVAAAAALLFAVSDLQIQYSQEARPYTMLVLGSLVSTGIWYRLNSVTQNTKLEASRRRAWFLPAAYVVVTALTFHANYLMVLTVGAHACWLLLRLVSIDNRKSQIDNLKFASGALFMTALACVPITWHFMKHRTSVFQGLDWIPAVTVASSIKVLTGISPGWLWVWILLVPAVVWVARMGKSSGALEYSPMGQRPLPPCPRSLCWLMLIWLAGAWAGLVLMSLMAHPVMVERYALPAAAPVVLLPLILLHQLDRRLPLLVAAVFAAGTSPVWLTRAERIKPGFREMVAFIDEYADPEKEALVVAIERTTSPGWEEMDLLGFEYYQSSKFEVQSSTRRNEATSQDERGSKATRRQGNEAVTLPDYQITKLPNSSIEALYLRNGQPDGDQPILREQRTLWVVTFLADPHPAIESSGRRVEKIKIGEKVFEQLSFEPYRLIRVAALR